MAHLEFEYNKAAFHIFRKLGGIFPELRARCLGYVGARGVRLLYETYLRGQVIDLKAFPTDAVGRPTVSYSVGRGAQYARISSYPLNLFERGRRWKSGKKEPAKRVMRGSFRQLMESRMAGIIMNFDQKILQERLDKL